MHRRRPNCAKRTYKLVISFNDPEAQPSNDQPPRFPRGSCSGASLLGGGDLLFGIGLASTKGPQRGRRKEVGTCFRGQPSKPSDRDSGSGLSLRSERFTSYETSQFPNTHERHRRNLKSTFSLPLCHSVLRWAHFPPGRRTKDSDWRGIAYFPSGVGIRHYCCSVLLLLLLLAMLVENGKCEFHGSLVTASQFHVHAISTSGCAYCVPIRATKAKQHVTAFTEGTGARA